MDDDVASGKVNLARRKAGACKRGGGWGGIIFQLALLLALGTTLFTVGCNDTTTPSPAPEDTSRKSQQFDPDTFRIASIFEPKDLHPMSGIEAQATVQIYRNLAYFEWNQETESWDRYHDLIKRYEISQDGKHCTIYLRDDVYFHNGDLMTADDVAYSLNKVLSTPAAQERNLNFILNAKVEMLSKHTLRLTSSKREAWESFFPNPILSAKYEKAWEGQSLSKYIPMGSGPYKFVSYDNNTKVMRLERFDRYYAGPGKFKRLEIRYYKNDEAAAMALMENSVDYFMEVSSEDTGYLKTNKKLTVFEMTSPSLFQIFLNTKTSLLSDWRVRRALSLLIDRQELVADKNSIAGEAVAADAPLFFVYPFQKPTVEPADAPTAMRLFAEAGWTKSNNVLMKDGKPFKIEIIYSEHNHKYLSALRAVVSKWSEAGIMASVKPWKFDEIFKIANSGNYFAFFAEFLESPDLAVMGKQYLTKGDTNWTGFSDPKVDELFHDLEKPSPPPLGDIRNQLQTLIREKAPTIALFYPKTYGAINNDFELDDKILKEPFGLYFIGNKADDKQN